MDRGRPPQFSTATASTAVRLSLRGYSREALAVYERGAAHFADPSLPDGAVLAFGGVMALAQLGRHAEAAATVEAMRASFGNGTPGQRTNIVVAGMCALTEQGELREPFEALIDEFEALRIRRIDRSTAVTWFHAYRVQGRLVQLWLASAAERPARVAAAEQAIRALATVAVTPMSKCAHAMARAALLQLRGKPRRAIAAADRVERSARRLDAPRMMFEVAHIRARAMRELGMSAEAQRQARIGLMLAATHGWEHRCRQLRAEFNVDDTVTVAQYTHAGDRAAGGGNRRFEALQQVSVAAAAVLDPAQLARVALDETLRILGAERALLFLVGPDGDLLPFAGRDAAGTDLDVAASTGSTLVQRVVETGEALVVTGADEGAALGPRRVVVHGLRSTMIAPMRLNGRLLGVVHLDSRMADGRFTTDDVEVLTAITGQVAVSLETARAAQLDLDVRTARRQQELAETLRSSLVELSTVLDPAQVLHRLFTTLERQLGARAGALLQGRGREFTVVAVAGSAAEAHGTLVGLGADPQLAALCEVRSPSVVPAGEAPPTVRELLDGQHTALVLPLRGRDGLAGVVVLGADAFDDTGREVGAALACQGMSAYDNARLVSRVQEQATTDGLTGVNNRRHFTALAGTLVDVARRGGHQLGAVMLDIDHVKRINDMYGNGVGDEVIREVAWRLATCVRHSDVVGRYGGDEFALILPDIGGNGAELAERMRVAVADTAVPTRDGPVQVTVSVGLAQLAAGDDGLDAVLTRADHALYRAKQAGRNRVETD